MKMLNCFTIQGVAYVPEEEGIRYKEVTTSDGRETLVVRLRFRHETGSKKDGDAYSPAYFYEMESWGATAKYILENVNNGDAFIFTGHIKTDKYKTKDGEARTKMVLVCDEFYRTYGSGKKKEVVDDEPEEDVWQSTASVEKETKPEAKPEKKQVAAEVKTEMPSVFTPATRARRPYGAKTFINADTGLLD